MNGRKELLSKKIQTLDDLGVLILSRSKKDDEIMKFIVGKACSRERVKDVAVQPFA